MKHLRYLLPLLAIGLLHACSQADQPIAQDPKEMHFSHRVNFENITKSEKMDFVVDTLLTDLDDPWAMEFLPSGDVLITERPGQLRLVRDGQLLAEPVSGLPEPILFYGQGGLLDVKKHPDYDTNGWIYISYSFHAADSASNTHLMRARLDGTSLVDQEVVFKAEEYFKTRHHFGGRIAFDKDNFLFFTVGERGLMDKAQHLDTYNGKVFRLFDDGRVPDDNPFVDVDTAIAAVWTYGHRNPQGMAFHPVTGELWTHEHGPMGGDEINIIEKGNNYGWPEITYGINYNGEIISEDTAKAGMEQPWHLWRVSIAPCGMNFMTSERYPAWKHDAMVGSLKFRYVARCQIENGKVVHEEKLIENLGRIRSVEEGLDGYFYALMEKPGMLVRLIPASEAPSEG